VTTLPAQPAGHETTAPEWSTVLTFVQRSIPLKGLRILNSGNPIATTSGTTELDLAKYALTGLTLVTNRYYLMRYLVTYTKSVATDAFSLKLRINTAVSGTQTGQLNIFAEDPAANTKELSFLVAGDSSWTAFYLSAVRTAGTGTLSYYGTSGGFVRSWAALYDVGDTDNWGDVA
jgi:hypothetical protein